MHRVIARNFLSVALRRNLQSSRSQRMLSVHVPALRLLSTNARLSSAGVTRANDIDDGQVGKAVKVQGWLHANRDMGENWFGVIRDQTGTVQFASFRNTDQAQDVTFHDARKTPLESAVEIEGIVKLRPLEAQRDPDQTAVEIHLNSFTVLNSCSSSKKLPITINLPAKKKTRLTIAEEEQRLRYRYLDLRSLTMQRILHDRSLMSTAARIYLTSKQDFLEIETPLLFKSTPEGASEFLVPSSLSSSQDQPLHYALPQSPQQYKQLLMAGGVSRYFQFAKCFRDEATRFDRQPEFTQIDMEGSFVSRADVLSITEGLVLTMLDALPHEYKLTPSEHPSHVNIESPSDLKDLQFPIMSFHDALNMYGSDKPDTRFEWTLEELPSSVQTEKYVVSKMLVLPGASALPKKELLALIDHASQNLNGEVEMLALQISGVKATNWKLLNKTEERKALLNELFFDPVSKRDDMIKHSSLSSGDVLFVAVSREAHQWQVVCEVLGRVRIGGMNAMQRCELIPSFPAELKHFLWVVDFPMFEFVNMSHEMSPPEHDATGGLKVKAVHHPFTSVHEDDKEMLQDVLSNIEKCFNVVRTSNYDWRTKVLNLRSRSYDLVVNGVEIGGGSIRIHDAQTQKSVFELIAAKPDTFQHLLEALEWGCPPHGGLALGFDRFVAVVCSPTGTPLRLREVIAFPKSNTGRDLLVGSPN